MRIAPSACAHASRRGMSDGQRLIAVAEWINNL
jgi:hypothetical protein